MVITTTIPPADASQQVRQEETSTQHERSTPHLYAYCTYALNQHRLACTPAEIFPISVLMPVAVTTAQAWPPVTIVPEKTMLCFACGIRSRDTGESACVSGVGGQISAFRSIEGCKNIPQKSLPNHARSTADAAEPITTQREASPNFNNMCVCARWRSMQRHRIQAEARKR